MTWYADEQEKRPADAAKEKLLAERAALEKQIVALKATPLRNRTDSAMKERVEQLTALAKRMVAIDTKIGRTHV